jgi:hypothetical protein
VALEQGQVRGHREGRKEGLISTNISVCLWNQCDPWVAETEGEEAAGNVTVFCYKPSNEVCHSSLLLIMLCVVSLFIHPVGVVTTLQTNKRTNEISWLNAFLVFSAAATGTSGTGLKRVTMVRWIGSSSTQNDVAWENFFRLRAFHNLTLEVVVVVVVARIQTLS